MVDRKEYFRQAKAKQREGKKNFSMLVEIDLLEQFKNKCEKNNANMKDIIIEFMKNYISQ